MANIKLAETRIKYINDITNKLNKLEHKNISCCWENGVYYICSRSDFTDDTTSNDITFVRRIIEKISNKGLTFNIKSGKGLTALLKNDNIPKYAKNIKAAIPLLADKKAIDEILSELHHLGIISLENIEYITASVSQECNREYLTQYRQERKSSGAIAYAIECKTQEYPIHLKFNTQNATKLLTAPLPSRIKKRTYTQSLLPHVPRIPITEPVEKAPTIIPLPRLAIPALPVILTLPLPAIPAAHVIKAAPLQLPTTSYSAMHTTQQQATQTQTTQRGNGGTKRQRNDNEKGKKKDTKWSDRVVSCKSKAPRNKNHNDTIGGESHIINRFFK